MKENTRNEEKAYPLSLICAVLHSAFQGLIDNGIADSAKLYMNNKEVKLIKIIPLNPAVEVPLEGKAFMEFKVIFAYMPEDEDDQYIYSYRVDDILYACDTCKKGKVIGYPVPYTKKEGEHDLEKFVYDIVKHVITNSKDSIAKQYEENRQNKQN